MRLTLALSGEIKIHSIKLIKSFNLELSVLKNCS